LLPPQPFDFSFNLVDDAIFNAFASPAANIFFLDHFHEFFTKFFLFGNGDGKTFAHGKYKGYK